MRIVALPGVFRPRSDTWLLASVLRGRPELAGGAVLDVCTGSGALAITAALAGARSVTAVDVSARALLAARINAHLNGVRVEVLRGSLLDAVPGRRFDVVVSNPPYLPAADDALPARGRARHTDAGTTGRALLDRLIAAAPAHLAPGGVLLVTHSSINGEEVTLGRMRAAGLEPSVAERRRGSLGPLLAARAARLEHLGLLASGERDEELLVVAGGGCDRDDHELGSHARNRVLPRLGGPAVAWCPAGMTDTMQAVAATPAGPGWAEIRTVPVPEPAAGEALIAVRAFGINRGELPLLTSRGDGWVPGQDIAGVVERAAADGSGPPAGTRVAALADWHGWAQYATAPTHRIAPLPDAVGFAAAAALPMAGTTALGVLRRGGALLGRRVLVTGASGGVGTFAVQLAELSGARVTAVARAAQAERLHERGAADVVADAADASGLFELVLESAGGQSMAAAIEHVAPGGLIVCFGNSSRESTPFSLGAFGGHANARIETYFSSFQEAHAGKDLEMLLGLIAAGRLVADIGLEAPWSEVGAALDALRDRQVAGKAVLRV